MISCGTIIILFTIGMLIVLNITFLINQSYIKMRNLKELSINNPIYYFYNDIINLKDFHSNVLKIDKKKYKEIDIYNINYITIKKSGNCKNINSLNPLYLMIHSSTGEFKERDGKKYLALDSTEKNEEVFSGIKKEIETINGGKELVYEKNYSKIDLNANDVPIYKPLKFRTLLIIIRCVFQTDNKLEPLVYLDECLYEI